MSHLKISTKELELFVTSMKVYLRKINEDHPHPYVYNHPVSKEKRYLNQTIGKIENEIKVRSIRPHKVTV